MKSILFRAAKATDEKVLLRMMRKLAEQEPGAYYFDEPVERKALRDFFANRGFGEIWILWDGISPAGYIILTLGFSFEYHGRDAFIDELYVETPYRRQGLGKRAVRFIEERAKNLGVQAIHLEADSGNDAALELYRRTGYEDHERYLMCKWLKSRRRKSQSSRRSLAVQE